MNIKKTLVLTSLLFSSSCFARIETKDLGFDEKTVHLYNIMGVKFDASQMDPNDNGMVLVSIVEDKPSHVLESVRDELSEKFEQKKISFSAKMYVSFNKIKSEAKKVASLSNNVFSKLIRFGKKICS